MSYLSWIQSMNVSDAVTSISNEHMDMMTLTTTSKKNDSILVISTAVPNHNECLSRKSIMIFLISLMFIDFILKIDTLALLE